MSLSNEQLIHEAVECNHAGVGATTLERYRDHLVHFAQYLASVHASDFYAANKKQVRLFMGHLEKQGGPNPDGARFAASGARRGTTRTAARGRAGRPLTARATCQRCVSSTATSRPTTNSPMSTPPFWSLRLG